MMETVWRGLPASYAGVDIDTMIVMPNHIHGIVVLVGAAPRGRPDSGTDPGQPRGVAPTLSSPDGVHRFKTMTTKRYADGAERSGWPESPGPLWQRNYYEHLIRSEVSLNRIRRYIADNPARWAFDRSIIG